MASTYGDRPLLGFRDSAKKDGFVFGARGTRLGSIARGLGSLLGAPLQGRDPSPPIALTLSKLLLWAVAGTVSLAACVVALGALALRIWNGAFT